MLWFGRGNAHGSAIEHSRADFIDSLRRHVDGHIRTDYGIRAKLFKIETEKAGWNRERMIGEIEGIISEAGPRNLLEREEIVQEIRKYLPHMELR